MLKTKKLSRQRLSALLPPIYVEAMNLVYSTERVKKSHQIELGLRMYLGDKHRKLLEDNGMDVWKDKR